MPYRNATAPMRVASGPVTFVARAGRAKDGEGRTRRGKLGDDRGSTPDAAHPESGSKEFPTLDTKSGVRFSVSRFYPERHQSRRRGNDPGSFRITLDRRCYEPRQPALSRSPMTAPVRTMADIDVELIRAHWSYLHSTWAGDPFSAKIAWARVDQLLDERQRTTCTGPRP